MSDRPTISNANSWLGPRSITQIRTDYHSTRPISSKRRIINLQNTIPGTKYTEYSCNYNTANVKGPILFDSPHVARVSSYPGVTFPKLHGTHISSAKSSESKQAAKEKSLLSAPLEKLRIESRQNTSESIINRILTHAERCRTRDTTRKDSPRTGLTDDNCYDYIVIKSFTARKSEVRQAINKIILSSKKKKPLPISPHLSERILRQASPYSRTTCSSRGTDSSSGRQSAKQERKDVLYSNNSLMKYDSSNSLNSIQRQNTSLKNSYYNERCGYSEPANNSRNLSRGKSGNSNSQKLEKERPFSQPILPKLITANPSCMFRLNGPILLSAPHGLKIWRGGTDGRRRRIHYREVYVTEIVIKLAMEINKYAGYPASFIIWDRKVAMPADFRNLDPNYLTEKQFPQSPWHEALEQFKAYGNDNKMPILHIDVHGKKDRKNNMDIDAGFRAMETRWPDKKFVEEFKEETHQAFTQVFNDPSYEKRGMQYAINVDPLLCGDWGGDLYTMTCQSVCLGVPSFQLEIPRTVRTRLVEDDDFATKFARAIIDIYAKCVLKDAKLPSVKDSDLSTNTFLNKVYNDHLKIEKAYPEKQI